MILALLGPGSGWAWVDIGPGQQVFQSSTDSYTNRLIVKLRNKEVTAQGRDPASLQPHLQALSTSADVDLSYLRTLSSGSIVVTLPEKRSLIEAIAIARKLHADPRVLYAEPDRWMRPLLVPNDGLFFQQWHYYEDTGGIRAPEAWEITTGDGEVVVAVIDTGILPHADLADRIIPGYDFVSDPLIANDGDGRDSDPGDPGDWVTPVESHTPGGPFEDCPARSSSWHGTHVSGTVAAISDNGLGVAGVNWGVRLLPVRVLGKCGGFLSDLVDGMRWAAGLAVPGVPDNPVPAQVLNLALGGSGSGPCSITQQLAILEIVASGKVIVVAAGNENRDVANSSPANCIGVISVGATTRSGGRAPYSNFGGLGSITLSAPGGLQFFPNDGNGVLSTLNTGTTLPQQDDFRFYSGTSMATAQVSGVVSLMLSINPQLTPDQVIQKLQTSARAFPDGSCQPPLCGAGIVDAGAAVRAAGTPPVVDAGPEQLIDPGLQVNLPGSAEDDGQIVGISWTQIEGQEVVLNDENTLTPSFIAPLPAGELVFRLTVIDDLGLEGTDTVRVIVNNLPPTLDPLDNKTVNAQQALNFKVTASDPNGIDPLLSAEGLPEGATLDPVSGMFDWPRVGFPGDYEIAFIATDAQEPNLADRQTVRITVLANTSSGGGGCSLGHGGAFDPLLPGLVIVALLYLLLRRRLEG